MQPLSFGHILSDARRRAGLSQRELAARISKEDGEPISPQYLNDLERDRRNPPGRHLLKQFASTLDLPEDYLDFVAGQLPEDLRSGSYAPDQVQAAFHAFRRTLQDANGANAGASAGANAGGKAP
jgi:transcriptional regulator with XRE-family HTH domain